MCWQMSKDKHFKVLNFKISYWAISLRFLIIFFLGFNPVFKKILGFKLGFSFTTYEKIHARFPISSYSVRKVFQKIFGLGTRFGILKKILGIFTWFSFFSKNILAPDNKWPKNSHPSIKTYVRSCINKYTYQDNG